MPRICPLSVAAFACCLAVPTLRAADPDAPQANVVGTWELSIEAEGQVFEPTVMISSDDGKLTIKYLSDEFGDHQADHVKLDGDKLTYVIAIDAPEGTMKLEFVNQVSGDQITGDVAYVVGDIAGSAAVVGKRSTPPVDPLGSWVMTGQAEGIAAEATLVITEQNGKLAVELQTVEIGNHTMSDVKLQGNRLSFGYEMDTPDGTGKASFLGTIDGDSLTGEIDYELGAISGTTEVEGRRQTLAALGSWKLILEAEGTVAEPTLRVTEKDGEIVVEMLTDELGDHQAQQVKLESDKLAFTIEVEVPEGSAQASFTMTIDGDKISGEVEYQLGDISGTTEVEGTRQSE